MYLWNLRIVYQYVEIQYVYIHIRGRQESYYSGDFIVKDSEVDNHLETLGYSSGAVSMYACLPSLMCVYIYITV